MDGRVLVSIVDDDESVRISLENLLGSSGFLTESFASAEALLHSPGLKRSACLIVDVRMPAMGGIALQRRLATTGPCLPIIFITAHDDDEARRRVLGLGAVGVLRKPFRDTELLEAIRRALAQGAVSEANRSIRMSFFTVKDGTELYYKDWGTGQPIVFSHGWPLTADAWDAQMVFLGSKGYRCIAHDRRGHGRSSQPWDGNEMDTYADDLAALVSALDLRQAIHVGHSTGGGEVARYLGRHGTARVAKAVLIGAVPPLMLKTPANPGGLPIDAFDRIRTGVLADRSQFFRDLSLPFYGFNRPGAAVSQGARDSFWLQGMLAGHKSALDCITAFSETDFTEDLKRIDVPTLILHGDDDQIVPIGASAMLSSKLVKGSTLKVYPGFPHGMCTTNADRINADLLSFIQA